MDDPSGEWMELCCALVDRLHSFEANKSGAKGYGYDRDYEIFSAVLDARAMSPKLPDGRKIKREGFFKIIGKSEGLTSKEVQGAWDRTIKRIKNRHSEISRYIRDDYSNFKYTKGLQELMTRDQFSELQKTFIKQIPTKNKLKSKS